MGDIEDIYADLEAEVPEEEFREAVAEKVERMGGLTDEETAAMLVAHELEESGGEIDAVADIEAGMEEVKFLAKVTDVGELRTFERDEQDAEEGRVLNVGLADESGTVRGALWDEHAASAVEELEVGQVLRVAGRPREGYNGLEVSVDRAEPDDADIDVTPGEGRTIDDLSLGQSGVTVQGVVLDTESVRTFDRDDGTEGRVANLVLGDETGRVRVTLWDERADRAEELDPGETVEVVEGYVRERDGDLELHVGDRGTIETIEEDVTYVPEATDIAAVEIDQTVDIAGVVRSADPKRTFDRDDGSEGQVRNIRLQDDTGDIRVALWGEKADADVGPGDELLVTDAEIQDGWQDEIEASAGWQATILVLSDGETTAPPETPAAETGSGDGSGESTGLDAFTGDEDDGEDETRDDEEGTADAESTGPVREFTGVVVQAGSPVILDDGERTVGVETDADLTLGEEITVRGTMRDDRLDAEEVSTPERQRAGPNGDKKD